MPEDYRLIGHTADVMIEATGGTLAAAFASAGQATFAFMTDIDALDDSASVDFSVTGEDRQALLYEFLDHLIYLRDIEELLFCRFDVAITETETGYRLDGTAYGQPLAGVEARDVKAATYSDMAITETETGYQLRAVLDI